MNKEELKEYQRNYYLTHKEEMLTRNRISAKKSIDRRKKEDPEGFLRNNRKYMREYFRELRKDPLFRMSDAISWGIRHALKTKKDGQKWEKVVGYTIQDLINHLEPLLKDGMTWENYGQWHVDHIRPKSSFEFSSIYDASFKECWALSNLQPLWAVDNKRKGKKLIKTI